MTRKMYGAFIVSLSAAALLFAASETFARPGGGVRGGVAAARAHPGAVHAFRHRRGFVGPWLGAGGLYYGPDGEPIMDTSQAVPNDVRYTYTYDVPWDWAHRYPPAVAPSDRPYVSSCPAESVTVRGRNGEDQTVNVIRCY